MVKPEEEAHAATRLQRRLHRRAGRQDRVSHRHDGARDRLRHRLVNHAFRNAGGDSGSALSGLSRTRAFLAWFERIRLRDSQGREFSEIVDLGAYNESLQLDPTQNIRIPTSKAPARDLTHVPVLRPFAFDAYRIDPKGETGVAKLFRAVPKASPVSTPPQPKQHGI